MKCFENYNYPAFTTMHYPTPTMLSTCDYGIRSLVRQLRSKYLCRLLNGNVVCKYVRMLRVTRNGFQQSRYRLLYYNNLVL